MAFSWTDVYGDTPKQNVPLDDAGQSLLDLVPEEKRPAFEPMLRGMLAQIRLQLGAEKYEVFVDDMKRAHGFYSQGDHANAEKIFNAYGIPYQTVLNMAA